MRTRRSSGRGHKDPPRAPNQEGGCREVTTEQLYNFLDDALDVKDAAVLEEHLARCGPCARTLARLELEYREQVLAFAQGQQVPLPPLSRFVQDALDRFQGQRAGAGLQQGSPDATRSDYLQSLLDREEPDPRAPGPRQDVLASRLPEERERAPADLVRDGSPRGGDGEED